MFRSTFVASVALMVGLGLGVPGLGRAQNAVTDWASIVGPAVNNPTTPRSPATAEILHTVVHLAVYDAVVAIEGGFAPFGAAFAAPAGADVNAAVATAAYRAALGRVASSQFAYLDAQYGAYMAGIPDGQAKIDGIAVGEAAAAELLALRANDGFNNVVLYGCSSVPPPYAEFEPNGGCGTQPVDTKVGQIVPFAISDPADYLPSGPDSFESEQWVRDFDETKDYGRADSSVRSPEQTDVAYFWGEQAYVFWNRNLNALAIAQGLDTLETARLFALVHTAASDAAIAGFYAKYRFRFVRPRTAIPRAAEDGNSRTEPDPTWRPLLTVNHPEYPSGHGFFSNAIVDAIASHFGTRRLTWTLTTVQPAVPQLVKTQRTYTNLNDIIREISDARVWAGLHWRNSMKDGQKLGDNVARDVLRTFREREDFDD